MTVTNQTNKTRQSGNGITPTFNFSFKIFSASDLEVYKIDTSVTPEHPSLQTITTDYTVTISTTTEGGSVTFVTPPTSDEDVFIKRVMEYTQETDIGVNVNFPETDVENEFDKSRMIDIQIDEATDRTLKLNQFYDGSADPTLPNPEASKVIGWDSTGSKMANFTGSDLDTALVTSFGEQLVTAADAEAGRDVLELGTTDNVEFAEITGTEITGTKVTTSELIASNLVGAVIPFAMETPPTGWLECDGSTISRTTYAALFSAIGTVFGVGDATTTFEIPDLRGQFVRGWDHGAGNDPDSATRTDSGDGSTTGDNVGTKQADEFKSHDHTTDFKGESGLNPSDGDDLTTVGTRSIQITSNTSGGSETRPINVGLMYCIKY